MVEDKATKPEKVISIQDLSDRDINELLESYQSVVLAGGFHSDREKQHFLNQNKFSFAHAHPNSVVVNVIGPHYGPGNYQKIGEMVLYMRWLGYEAWLEEIIDDGMDVPSIATVNTMKDAAVLSSLSRGPEWICLVHSDIEPEPDLIARLLSHDRSVISPIVIDPKTGSSYGFPSYEPGTGVVPVRWCDQSMILFRATIFNCIGIDALSTCITESALTRKLWYYGHRYWVDTGAELEVSKPPHYPGDMTFDEMMERKRQLWDNRKDIPDRQPIDPNNPLVVHGIWMPWGDEAIKWQPNGQDPE